MLTMVNNELIIHETPLEKINIDENSIEIMLDDQFLQRRRLFFKKIAIASCNSFQNSNNSKQSALAPGGRGEAPSGGSQRRAARGRRGAVAKVWVRRCRSGQAGGQRVLPGCCNPASSLADR